MVKNQHVRILLLKI